MSALAGTTRPRALGVALCFALLAGCASAREASRTDSSVLTRGEMDGTGVETAMDAIRQLRPQYLRPRTVVSVAYPSASYPVVYVNGLFRGDMSSLRSILVLDVEEIHFVSPSDATTRWGTGHSGGVIHVVAN